MIRWRDRAPLHPMIGFACAAALLVVVACASAPPVDRSGPAPVVAVTSPETQVPNSGPARTPVLRELGVPELATITRGRAFRTGFEDATELAPFYATPQSSITHHEVSGELVHSGTKAHKAWVTGVGGPGLEKDGPNHRGYPTIQLDKVTDPVSPGFSSPSIVELWVWLDVALTRGQWLSFATFSNDPSDRWERVVTVNIGPEGYVNIFHAPRPNQNDLALQRTDVPFPMKTWVKLTTYLDFREDRGAIAVWQDDVLIAASRVDPTVDPGVLFARDQLGLAPAQISDRLQRLHFGLYSHPDVGAALVLNDDVSIAEVVASKP